MKENFENAINWLKIQNIDGCITGSYMLGYKENWQQDLDVFVYDENSLRKILFACQYNDMFQILDPIEKWKWETYRDEGNTSIKKLGLLTIKVKYNLCVDINIILKNNKNNIFAVLSSFDLDIICKGYDIKTKQFLDIGNNSGTDVNWNVWNTNYYNPGLWRTGQLLRQFQRVVKYYKRGYNTDKVALKYIELIDLALNTENIFNSETYKEKITDAKINLETIRKIINMWLELHDIDEATLDLLDKQIKKL